MKPIELRPYQQSFIDSLRSQIKCGQRRICGVAPCGAGKTIMMGFMIKGALERSKRAIFFVHRKELIDQTVSTFRDLGIPFGIIASNVEPHYELPVQIASVQTLTRRLDKIPQPDLLICDEAHHILAKSYKNIIDKWTNSILIGVTATPERTGGIRLGDIFSAMVEAPTVSELIELGNLTNFKYFAPVAPVDLALDKARVKYGEFVNSDLEPVMTNPKIIGSIVDNYRRYAGNAPAICYCVNVKHSQYVAEKFNEAGISAAHVDGETDPFVRRRIVDAFRRNQLQILCNAELFGEGFDVPNVSAVILARPTMSLTLYIQQSMRGMRPDPANPDKTAIIIDHVGNYARFGLPDHPREWSLTPKPKKTAPPETKQCPQCSAVITKLTRVCPNCGYEFFEAPQKDDMVLAESKGTIAQIHDSKTGDTIQPEPSPDIPRIFYSNLNYARNKNLKPAWAVFKTLDAAQSYEDCLKIANLAGYKAGWAHYKWQEIQAKRLAL